MSTIQRSQWKAQQPNSTTRIDLEKLDQNPEAKQALQAAGLDMDRLRAADRNQDAKLNLDESWSVADHFDHDGHSASLIAVDQAGNTTASGQALNTLGLLLHNKDISANVDIDSDNPAHAEAQDATSNNTSPTATSESVSTATEAANQTSVRSDNNFSLNAEGKLDLGTEYLDGIQQSHGPMARQRFEHWQKLINDYQGKSDTDKIAAVEMFFNHNIRYVSDQNNQGLRDYWQDPVESLKLGKGDCEDYAVAKYATLRMLGLDADKLHLTYVNLQGRGGHEVLLAERDDFAKPVILDNMTYRLTFPDERNDLRPIFWANENGAHLVDKNWQSSSDTMPLSRFRKLSDVFARMSPLLGDSDNK